MLVSNWKWCMQYGSIENKKFRHVFLVSSDHYVFCEGFRLGTESFVAPLGFGPKCQAQLKVIGFQLNHPLLVPVFQL